MDKHDTLLVCSHSQENRALLRGVLEKRYHLLEASNSQQTMLLLKQNLSCIAALLLDVSTGKAPQEDILTQQEAMAVMDRVPVIAICRKDSSETVSKAFDLGAADVIPLHYEPSAMLHRIETVADLHLHKQYLQTMVQEQADALRHSNETMVDALSSIIEYRSVESGQHILRIRHFTRILLQEVVRACPEYGLDDTAVSIISSASALHDIGKIAIPDSILMKPGPLTPQEREVMKSHARTGCQILDTLGDVGDPEYMRYAHNICHYHHERWDGGGYPEGLSEDAIPICAQVVGLADVYDALTTKRVYKDAIPFHRAVNMILQGECGVFSPRLLECFKHVTEKLEDLARAYADGMSPKAESFDVTLPAPAPLLENDSMERVRAKYFALVHYIDGFLMEMDLNRNLFHLIYNPYPELAPFHETSSLEEIKSMILDQVVMPGEKQRMNDFLSNGIQQFLDQDLRRMTQYFRLQSLAGPEGELFEITLLRINPIDSSRRSLAVLGRRVQQSGADAAVPAGGYLSDSTCCCLNDEYFTLLRLGDQVPLLAGYSREELREQFHNHLLELVLPEDRKQMRSAFREQLTRGVTVETEFRVRHKNGSILWVLDKSRLSIGPDGTEYLNVFLTDISHTKRAYDALNETLRRYEIILAQTENVLFEWDMEADTITFSETWEKIFGFPPIRAGVRDALREGSYFHPDDLPRLLDCVSNIENGSVYEMVETRIATARGRYLWCRFRASAIRDKQGRLQKLVGIIINIDAEKQAERMLQDRAERDSLTKLLNKNAARKQAEEYLSRFPGGADCALLIIDLDNFKQVNDQYGHLFGDAVLAKAAREIEKLFRAQDILSRIGGDEFLVLMRGVSDRQLLENRCRRLIQIFQNIFSSPKTRLPLSCSIGIALSPEHGSTYPELFHRADQALYRAKAGGKNRFRFYDGTDEKFPLPQSRKPTHIDSDEEPGLADDNIVRYAFQRLYSARNVESSINEILALIGRKMNVSRVYVFENSDDNRYCRNTYEWCNEGIQPEIGNLQNISYETDIPGYEDNFNEQGIFYCPDIAVLPEKAYDIVEAQGIKSMLQCAIREGGAFRGYIGFDECVEQRFWTKEQIQTLTYFSEMLSLFLLKQRRQEKALMQAADLNTILDNQNAWIYIIDPDSCRLKYLNAKTRTLAPDVQPGMRCHKALMGLEERCPGCPAAQIRSSRNCSALMTNERFGLKVQADATLIQWKGEESCLLTCRELPSVTEKEGFAQL